jgi:hypothetical protein
MLEAEWRQVLWGSVSTGAKEDESIIGRIWAAGLHHVIAHSCLACILKLMNCLLFKFSNFFSGHVKLWITETEHTKSVGMRAHPYNQLSHVSGY